MSSHYYGFLKIQICIHQGCCQVRSTRFSFLEGGWANPGWARAWDPSDKCLPCSIASIRTGSPYGEWPSVSPALQTHFPGISSALLRKAPTSTASTASAHRSASHRTYLAPERWPRLTASSLLPRRSIHRNTAHMYLVDEVEWR